MPVFLATSDLNPIRLLPASAVQAVIANTNTVIFLKVGGRG